ncbi:MAG TPA: hypothetical protein PLR74_07980 [Agriterribacter sp.]|nr:hypothetical protein [Agriterribacter sp.]
MQQELIVCFVVQYFYTPVVSVQTGGYHALLWEISENGISRPSY